MLSRVANSIYWMSRYVERAENVARSVDVNLHVVLDLPSGLPEQWDAVVKITGDYEAFNEIYPENSKDDVIEFLTFDRQNPNSIVNCVKIARENARSMREIISSDMWEGLNEFYLEVQDGSARERARETPHEFFRDVRRASHLLEGVTSNTLSHGEAFHFFRLGRMLERADQTTRILDVKYFLLLPDVADVGTTVDALYWSAILRSASAFEMYRKEHGQIAPDLAAEFLVLDREFPRSVHFCAMRAADSLHFITGTPRGTFQNPAEQCLGRLVAQLDYTDIHELINRGLHESLDHLQSQLNDVGDSIFETFFS